MREQALGRPHDAASMVGAIPASAGRARTRWTAARSAARSRKHTCAFVDLLDDFGGLESSAGDRSPAIRAVQWLRCSAARTHSGPRVATRSSTIFSQMTDPIVQYDGVWVSGLHADAWPAPSQPDPFIPCRRSSPPSMPAASTAGRAVEARNLMASWAGGVQRARDEHATARRRRAALTEPADPEIRRERG